jgi:hypothetical protein
MVLINLCHEFGLFDLNTSPHVFAMCHLYNALKKSNRLNGGWKPIDTLSERLMNDLFMRELPDTIEATQS